jgi:hypothetical protein
MARDALESLLHTPVNYDSFLLRRWRTAAGGDWRWMLEDVMTGSRHTFTNLPDLVIFLHELSRENKGSLNAKLLPRHRSGAGLALPPLAAASTEEQP